MFVELPSRVVKKENRRCHQAKSSQTMPPSSVGDLSLELLRLSLSQRQAKRRLIDGVAERLQLERVHATAHVHAQPPAELHVRRRVRRCCPGARLLRQLLVSPADTAEGGIVTPRRDVWVRLLGQLEVLLANLCLRTRWR